MVAALTLGVEEELHLVDPRTSLLTPRAPQLLAALPQCRFGAELQRTTVETNTGVWHTLEELRSDIVRLRRMLIDVAAKEGLRVAAVGTGPLNSAAEYDDLLTDPINSGVIADAKMASFDIHRRA